MKDITQEDLENKAKLVSSYTGGFRIEGKEFVLGKGDFIVIAGPCRVESVEQMEKVVKTIKENNLRFIRAGAYKHYTFPYSQRGLGEEGLKILKEISDKYNLISVSEISAVSQIEFALKYVDVFQIGARHMQNLDLLTEIGKSKKPALLKRHHGSSLRDLIGAAEWLLYYGCKNLILCERGIVAPYTHDKDANWLLDFQIVPAVKRICKLPIIMDVSHSSGNREFVSYLAPAVAASGADGLMIEIHPEPDKSQSDKNQIIGLEEFTKLMIKVRKVADALDKKVV